MKTRLWKIYSEIQNRPIQNDVISKEAGSTISTVPSYSVVERPTESLSDSPPKRKGKSQKMSGFNSELKEILLDSTNQYS